MAVEEKVKEIIVDQLKIDSSKVTEQASFIEDLGLDLLDKKKLFLTFENKFKVKITAEDVEKITTVGATIEYLIKKIKVTEKVKEIIIDQLGVDYPEVAEGASFIEDLGADSLDTVELVMAFEDEFKVEIADEDAEKITKVGSAIEYLFNKA